MGELIGLAAVIGVFGIPIIAIWTRLEAPQAKETI